MVAMVAKVMKKFEILNINGFLIEISEIKKLKFKIIKKYHNLFNIL